MFKKNLLNTTALAAIIGTAGVISVSNPAHSQEISIGAYVKTLIGFWSDDRENQNTIAMRNDAEVHVKASSTSDTGLDYGIAIELGPVSSTTDTEFQEADLFIRGEFGTVRLGDNDGAGDSLSVFAPTGFGTGGIDGNFGDWAGGVATALKPVDTGDNTKITYFTPKVNNIQAGVSFSPQRSKGKNVITSEASSGYENGIEFGVNFVGDVGDGINLQAGVTGSLLPAAPAAPPGTDDNFSFLIGAKATVENLSFGGGFVTFGDANNNDIGFNAGVQYTQGAFVFGANMSFVQAENIRRASTLTLAASDIETVTVTPPGGSPTMMDQLTADAVSKINAALADDPSIAASINDDRLREWYQPVIWSQLRQYYRDCQHSEYLLQRTTRCRLSRDRRRSYVPHSPWPQRRG